MNMIFILAKKLPKPIRDMLRSLYDFWRLSVVVDPRILRETAEYYELSRKETIHLMRSGCQLNADLWRAFHPKSDQEKNEFYEFTPFYIFELLYWHMQKHQRDFRKDVIQTTHGRVLDFGGGPGDLSATIAEQGLSVTYADVEGKTFDFAEWIFRKRNLPVKMINLSKCPLEGDYDTIICIDVIEHVPNPKETLVMLAEHLNRGGFLIITNLEMEEVLEIHPMHNIVDFRAKEYLISQGFVQKKPWLWIKK